VSLGSTLVHLRVLELQAEDLPAMRSQGLKGASSCSVLQFHPKILKCPSATAHVAVRLREKASSTTRYFESAAALRHYQDRCKHQLLTRTQMAGRCKCGSTKYRPGSLTETMHPDSLLRSPTAPRTLSPAAGRSHFHWPALFISFPLHSYCFFARPPAMFLSASCAFNMAFLVACLPVSLWSWMESRAAISNDSLPSCLEFFSKLGAQKQWFLL
jgi:hypothetical protein